MRRLAPSRAYNDAIRLCLELGDGGSRELIEANLHDEEEHLDWLEAQLDQINQMGLAKLSSGTGIGLKNPTSRSSEREVLLFDRSP